MLSAVIVSGKKPPKPSNTQTHTPPGFGAPSMGSPERGHPDLFRFVPISPFSSDLRRTLFSGIPQFVPICSDFFRFVPICSDLFRFVFRTNQNKSGKPPFCRPLLQVPEGYTPPRRTLIRGLRNPLSKEHGDSNPCLWGCEVARLLEAPETPKKSK